jgi:hypothetical protein
MQIALPMLAAAAEQSLRDTILAATTGYSARRRVSSILTRILRIEMDRRGGPVAEELIDGPLVTVPS